MAKKSSERESRDRLLVYQARTKVHEEQKSRRRRDNLWSLLALAVIFAAAVGAQLWYLSQAPEPDAAETAAPTAPAGQNQGDVPPVELSENRNWTGEMSINGIPMGFELFGALAPQAVASEVSLINSGFYTSANTCHRLTNTQIWVLQCGSPTGDSTGNPGYSYGPVENAPLDNVYPAGTIAMARGGDNGYSHGSQFFIVYQDTTLPSDSAGGYSVIGNITSGLPELAAYLTSVGVVDGATDGAPAQPITISSISVR